MTNDGPLADVMITLGARDLSTLRAFYGRLGLPQLIDDEDFAAFDLRGVVLAVFPLEKLARDGNTQADLTGVGIRSTIGIMVDSGAEVRAHRPDASSRCRGHEGTRRRRVFRGPFGIPL